MKNIVAIDIGQSGGFSWCINGEIGCLKMPDTEGDVFSLIKKLLDLGNNDVTFYLEKVGGYGGNNKGTGSSMFNFGYGNGVLVGILMALGVRVIRVIPATWQKRLGVGTASSCINKTEWKNKLKAEAQRRFPRLKITLAVSDALLILDYAMTLEK